MEFHRLVQKFTVSFQSVRTRTVSRIQKAYAAAIVENACRVLFS